MSTPNGSLATSTTNGGTTLRNLLGALLLTDAVLSVLGATVNSLDLYMGGTALEASHTATTSAAVVGWVLNVIVLFLVQGFIMFVAGFIGVIFIAVASKQLGDGFLSSLFKRYLYIATPLALLAAAYNGFVHYGLFSVAHANPALNMVASVLTAILTVAYVGFGICFFITVLSFIVRVFTTVLANANNASSAPKNEHDETK